MKSSSSKKQFTKQRKKRSFGEIMDDKKQIVVREVWDDNLEFSHIQSILKDHPYISIDTEFPGRVYDLDHLKKDVKSTADLTSDDAYALIKANVDSLKLIQLGLTLSDRHGDSVHVWQFNFREFDLESDKHNESSVQFLARHGIDFLRNKERGVHSKEFAELFKSCFKGNKATWITFCGTYDLAYLIKAVTQSNLPKELGKFMGIVKKYFKDTLYDVKMMMGPCRLSGGLNVVAKRLKVERVAGKAHQAGSDSLLTMQVFMKMNDVYFQGENAEILSRLSRVLYGLNLEVKKEFCV